MSSYLSRHEIDDLRSELDRMVSKVVGNSDSAIRTIVEQCLHSGYDRKRTTERLADVLDSRKAAKIYDRLEDLLTDRASSKSSRKRTHTNNDDDADRRSQQDRVPDLQAKKAKAPESRERDRDAVTAQRTPAVALSSLPPAAVAAAAAAAAAINAAVAASAAAAAAAEPKSTPAESIASGNGNGTSTASAPLTSNQIQQMMANAQREIEERKRALSARRAIAQGGGLLPLPGTTPALMLQPSGVMGAADKPSLLGQMPGQQQMHQPSPEEIERARKIADLQAQIRAKLSGINTHTGAMVGGLLTGGVPAAGLAAATATATAAALQEKPKPLILDEEGRTVDKTGRTISIPTLAPTLKANIRAKKKEIFNKASQPTERPFEEEGQQFFDERIMAKSAVRNKRLLRFHEPGKFQQQAERMRMKAQLEKLQNEISQIARKTGISSATKLALIAPKQDSHADDVPQMEWWDSVILMDDLNTMDGDRLAIRESAITNLIEHPTQMKPPNDPSKPVYLPVFLTQKERKKLRRQNRREAWKEEQEKIRIGLATAPEPKLRISNLMRVLGTEAVQDPTKIEAHVREQMAKRQKAHEDANNARKLTAEQKRDKKIRKVKEDTSCGVQVSVYRIRELHDIQAKKFKVETNAKQLLMTGVVTLFRDCCVVVVEGGPKQQKKYRRLMMQRIKWDEDMVKNADGNEVPNSCVLVWEGSSQRRHFGEVKFKPFPMEKMAREFFQKHQVEHYWDLAYSGAVLEASEDM